MITLESTDQERAVHYFEETRNRVLEVTTGLSDAQWRFKPAPDVWSIAENLEHMVLAQEWVLGPMRERLMQAPAPAAGRDNEQIEKIIFEKIPDRSARANAPEFAVPTGQWPPRVSLDRLLRNYERLSEFVESNHNLREHVLESPPLKFITKGALETMDGYQFALMVSAHDRRHLGQIRDVLADPNYPA
jgi:DinB superfamily